MAPLPKAHQPRVPKNILPETTFSKPCDICILSKHKRAPHRKTPATRATHPFELIHSDSYSIFGNPSLSGTLHYLLFIDDFTRWTFVYFLNSKNAENCTQAFRKTLADNGIIFEPSPPYTQNMNGVSEMFGANGGSRPFMDGPGHRCVRGQRWIQAIHGWPGLPHKNETFLGN